MGFSGGKESLRNKSFCCQASDRGEAEKLLNYLNALLLSAS